MRGFQVAGAVVTLAAILALAPAGPLAQEIAATKREDQNVGLDLAQMAASIVRMNILKPIEFLKGRNFIPRLVLNGSIIDNYQPEIVEVHPVTGVVLDDRGNILTHLALCCRMGAASSCRVEVFVPADKRIWGKIVGVDERTGVAVVNAESAELKPAPVKSAPLDAAQLGGKALALILGGRPRLVSGRIEQVALEPETRMRSLIVSFRSAENNHSQAILDAQGNVIGISIGGSDKGLSEPETVVLPVSEALPIAERIVATRASIPGGWLGVYVSALEPQLRKQLNTDGVCVSQVERNSPAERAGLKAGDIIVRYDGITVKGLKHFANMVRGSEIGRRVKIGLLRDGKRKDLEAVIAKRPESAQLSENLIQLDLERELRAAAPTMAAQIEVIRLQPSGEQLELLSPARPMLGVFVDNLTAQLGEYFGVKEGKGALVTAVLKGSPGERAGLKAGDVIIRIDDVEVANRWDIASRLREKNFGDQVKVTVMRERKPMEFYVSLEKPKKYR